jgi:hypothetical protein
MPRKASDLLGFQDRKSLLGTALARASSNPFNGAMTQSSGVFVTARNEFSWSEMSSIAADREQRVLLEKAMKKFGQHLVREAQKLTRTKDTIKTRLLISSWRATVDDEGFDVKTRVTLRNDAPYAVYVHPKGRPRQNLIRYHMKGEWLKKRQADLLADLKLLKPRLAAIVKNRALREARKARTTTRQAG